MGNCFNDENLGGIICTNANLGGEENLGGIITVYSYKAKHAMP